MEPINLPRPRKPLDRMPCPPHMTQPPPCPPWCGQHVDAPAWPEGDDFRIHFSSEWMVHSRVVCLSTGVAEQFDIVAVLDQFDDHGQPGTPYITVGARHWGEVYEAPPRCGALDRSDRMSPAVARQLAVALLELADAGDGITAPGAWVEAVTR